MTQTDPLPRAGQALRERALQLPEAYEEFPWGHHAIKVKGKSFLFLGTHEGTFSMSAKLPQSSNVALSLPFASPTEYGLGRSGWVTARFPLNANVPVDLLAEWIEESYRAIAPKKLAAGLDGASPAAGTPKPKPKDAGAVRGTGVTTRRTGASTKKNGAKKGAMKSGAKRKAGLSKRTSKS
jgi:predicted DNA-binding protein (MmcQ/YjbR family)